MDKSDRMNFETRALWIEVFGEAPGPDIDPSRMIDILLQRLEPKGYSRLTQATRARNLTFPDGPR